MAAAFAIPESPPVVEEVAAAVAILEPPLVVEEMAAAVAIPEPPPVVEDVAAAVAIPGPPPVVTVVAPAMDDDLRSEFSEEEMTDSDVDLDTELGHEFTEETVGSVDTISTAELPSHSYSGETALVAENSSDESSVSSLSISTSSEDESDDGVSPAAEVKKASLLTAYSGAAGGTGSVSPATAQKKLLTFSDLANLKAGRTPDS
jgi:hypothetical protein